MTITENHYTPIQLKLPVDYEKIIDINDPVYSFVDVLNHIDLKKYIVEIKNAQTGRQLTQEQFAVLGKITAAMTK